MKEALITLAAGLALCAVAYTLGHGKAEAEGRAALNALKVERAEEQRRAAEAYGKALAEARDKHRKEVARADALVTELAEQDRDHADQAQQLRRQIRHVAQNSALTLSPDTVRLLNEAAGIPDNALPGTLCSAGAAGETGACAPAGAGVLAGVSEADLIAWFADFAGRSRWLELRLAAWQTLYTQGAEAREDK